MQIYFLQAFEKKVAENGVAGQCDFVAFQNDWQQDYWVIVQLCVWH